MSWLVISIALSVVLTVILNVGLRAFSGSARHRAAPAVMEPQWPAVDQTRHRRVRVWTPWKAMIVGSLVLTIAVNLVLWIV